MTWTMSLRSPRVRSGAAWPGAGGVWVAVVSVVLFMDVVANYDLVKDEFFSRATQYSTGILVFLKWLISFELIETS
jgi:hypothetical protein